MRAAKRPGAGSTTGRKNSHQPFRRREGAMARFRDIKTLQKFHLRPCLDPQPFQPPTPSQSPRHFQTRPQVSRLRGRRPSPIRTMRCRLPDSGSGHVNLLPGEAELQGVGSGTRPLINDNYSCRLPRTRSAGSWTHRESCETARFPCGGRVDHGCPSAAIARETNVGEDVGGGRGGGRDERADGATRRCCVNRNWHRALPRVGSSPIDRERLWSTKLGHSIEHVARKHRFDSLRCASPTSKSIAENRLVPEERVLDAGLSMIADLLLPSTAPNLADPSDRPIAAQSRLTPAA